MEITRSNLATGRGPSDWFTGDVYIDTVAVPSHSSRVSASAVHFTPGARRHRGPIEVIRPGDRVFFEPAEEHWHGAAPTRFMIHVAMLDVDDEGNTATWGDHVSDDEYAAAPAVDQ